MPVGPEELLDADDTPEPAGKSLFFQSKSFQAKYGPPPDKTAATEREMKNVNAQYVLKLLTSATTETRLFQVVDSTLPQFTFAHMVTVLQILVKLNAKAFRFKRLRSYRRLHAAVQERLDAEPSQTSQTIKPSALTSLAWSLAK